MKQNYIDRPDREFTTEELPQGKGSEDNIPSVRIISPHSDDKVPYSLAKSITKNDNIICFDDRQRALMNTLDECKARGETNLPLDVFIRRYYHQPTYEVKPEERKQFLTELTSLSILTGVSITQSKDSDGNPDIYNISAGALIPIKVNASMRANGTIIKDGITIMDYTCIHGVETHKVEYWRLQFPNPLMRKTERNVRITHTVLEKYLKGEAVDISKLCDELDIADKQTRKRLIQTVVDCINYQRQKTQPEPSYIYDDSSEDRGRPSIKAIETK